jgi:hypothetical protein
MSKIKLKKLSLQFSYLKLEKEEIEEECASSEKHIRSYLKEKYPEHYDSFFGVPPKVVNQVPPEETAPAEEVSEEQEVEPAIPKNGDTRKLYRKIVEKTHPDKVGNDSQADVFLRASEAYENQDIATLLEIAASFNIELTSLHPETLALFENNIKTISDEIVMKKGSVAWAWSQAKTDEEKDKLLQIILKNKGII